MRNAWWPAAEGLYRPDFEHDACGIGFVANVGGQQSHEIVRQGIQVLERLDHRGAVGSDPETGDGAGMLMQIPDRFFRERAAELKLDLPPSGQYAVGMVYLPKENGGRCQEILNQALAEEGCRALAWRNVPVDESACGRIARSGCRAVKQVFVVGPAGLTGLAFERKLYVARRVAEHRIRAAEFTGHDHFYVVSLSSRVVNYKGMLTAGQVFKFYPDLSCPELVSALAVVHSRYSTNTFPSWPLAHPFRMLCHNGEINTLRGNINKMTARHHSLASEIWGDDVRKLLPVIYEGQSDSACFDNMLELLVLSGRSLAHAILMMIPEAWGTAYHMGHDRRGFYEYHSMFMEPWDGPASIAFTDGVQVGGILDRNGLRPSRFTLTKSGLIVLSSETGVLDIPPSEVERKGRLQPGRMLLVDTARQRVLYNDDIKADVCRQQHYRRWVTANRIELEGFGGHYTAAHSAETLMARQLAFGYTQEDVDVLITPMAAAGDEPIGSMGNDAPLAVLSDQPQLLFNYFKQLFAQVTNPPIDPIREQQVMSLTTYLGREGNLLAETPEHARRLKLKTPILTDADLERIRDCQIEEFRSLTLDITFPVSESEKGLEAAMSRLCREAQQAVEDGYTVIILSDRAVSAERAAAPSLLAVSGVGHHLIRSGIRNRVGLVLESGEPREVNHFALLSSFGCDAVNPYLALETVSALHSAGHLPSSLTLPDAIEHYIKAASKGIMKILSKMGISTLRSYRGAQVYEAVGLGRELVDLYFTKTVSRLGGVGLRELGREALLRHATAFGTNRGRIPTLPSGGVYSFRRDGERHLWTPEAIYYLQRAVRAGEKRFYERFSELINNQTRRYTTLRSLLDFRADSAKAIPLDQVEPAAEIVKRFVTGAMSFGSLSREVHEAMAIAMNRLGGSSNSGEGGEDAARYVPLPNGDSRCSMTKQVASGRFGVTIEYLANCRELQIKIAQGAKPGEGGHLPGHKVNEEIARVRNSTPGVSLISPPPHHDIYSIEDLAQLIFDLKNANPDARISVKLVSVSGVGTIASGVAKGHADMVLISGGDGGTGASPLSSIKHAGLPWELGLSETHQTLLMNDLRGRIRVQTDGQMRTGRDVAIAACLGAEEYGFGTATLISLGCVMMRKCHANTCPVGVATQDPRCRERFSGKPEHLINYLHFVAEEMRQIMASVGVRTVNELVGRTDLLRVREGLDHWKAKTLDFSGILHQPKVPAEFARYRQQAQDHGIDQVLDRQLIEKCAPAIEKKQPVKLALPIRNRDRTTGAMLSYHIAKRYGLAGLPENTVQVDFAGSAGQSFGAFLAHGVTFTVTGDANDYTGKGLSGGRIVVKPDPASAFEPEQNVIIGNVVLYGATSGELYARGLAGERFCIRNSGATAVVEGVGDHGCEYMTGGRAVILGPTGVNFGAGMSGGIAYVYDPDQDFDLRCNLDMIDLDPILQPDDQAELKALIEKHRLYTGSARAKYMLEHWDLTVRRFVKVFPMEYRRALGQMAKIEIHARRTAAEKVEQA